MSASVAEARDAIAIRDAFLREVSRKLGLCIERVARGTAPIDDLRGFARELAIIAGDEAARAPRRTPLDGAVLAREAAARWNATFDAVGDATGVWDRDLVQTVLDELLSNARKYGGPHRVAVWVDGAREDIVRFAVDDHEGEGIGNESVANDRFVRGSGTQALPGFGIGVWLVRVLTDAHGGSFRLERRAAGGTRATVELPRR